MDLNILVLALVEALIAPQLENQHVVNAAWVEADPIPQGDGPMLQDHLVAHVPSGMLQEHDPGHQADMLQVVEHTSLVPEMPATDSQAPNVQTVSVHTTQTSPSCSPIAHQELSSVRLTDQNPVTNPVSSEGSSMEAPLAFLYLFADPMLLSILCFLDQVDPLSNLRHKPILLGDDASFLSKEGLDPYTKHFAPSDGHDIY